MYMLSTVSTYVSLCCLHKMSPFRDQLTNFQIDDETKYNIIILPTRMAIVSHASCVTVKYKCWLIGYPHLYNGHRPQSNRIR